MSEGRFGFKSKKVGVCSNHKTRAFLLQVGQKRKNRSASDRLVGMTLDLRAPESGRRDSNPRPSPWQGDVLPLYYSRIDMLNYIALFLPVKSFALGFLSNHFQHTSDNYCPQLGFQALLDKLRHLADSDIAFL